MLIKRMENRLFEYEREIKTLINENDHLRQDNKVICDKYKMLCEEKDMLIQKAN